MYSMPTGTPFRPESGAEAIACTVLQHMSHGIEHEWLLVQQVTVDMPDDAVLRTKWEFTLHIYVLYVYSIIVLSIRCA